MKTKLKLLSFLFIPAMLTFAISSCGSSENETGVSYKNGADLESNINEVSIKDSFLLGNEDIKNDFQRTLKLKNINFEAENEYNSFYYKYRNKKFLDRTIDNLPAQGIVDSQTASLINHYNGGKVDWKIIDDTSSSEEINILYKEKEFCELAKNLSSKFNILDLSGNVCGINLKDSNLPAEINLNKVVSELPKLTKFLELVTNTNTYVNKENIAGKITECIGDQFFWTPRYDGKNYWDSPTLDLAGGRDALRKNCRLISRITNRYDLIKTGLLLGKSTYGPTILSDWYFPGYETPETKPLFNWRPTAAHGIVGNVINEKDNIMYQFAKNKDNWNLISTKFISGLKDGLIMSENWETLFRIMPNLKSNSHLYKMINNNTLIVPENEYSNGYKDFISGKSIFYIGHKKNNNKWNSNIKKLYSKNFNYYWFKKHNLTFANLNENSTDFTSKEFENFVDIEFNKSQEIVNWFDEIKFGGKSKEKFIEDTKNLMEDIKNSTNRFNSIVNY